MVIHIVKKEVIPMGKQNNTQENATKENTTKHSLQKGELFMNRMKK